MPLNVDNPNVKPEWHAVALTVPYWRENWPEQYEHLLPYIERVETVVLFDKNLYVYPGQMTPTYEGWEAECRPVIADDCPDDVRDEIMDLDHGSFWSDCRGEEVSYYNVRVLDRLCESGDTERHRLISAELVASELEEMKEDGEDLRFLGARLVSCHSSNCFL